MFVKMTLKLIKVKAMGNSVGLRMKGVRQINLPLPTGSGGLLTNDFKHSELVILCLQCTCNCKIVLIFLRQFSSS